jgi:hypothetical protein
LGHRQKVRVDRRFFDPSNIYVGSDPYVYKFVLYARRPATLVGTARRVRAAKSDSVVAKFSSSHKFVGIATACAGCAFAILLGKTPF